VQRAYEFLLGLEPGFLAREGRFDIAFRPRWPWQETFGAASWNLLLVTLGVVLVVWAYRRDGRTRAGRVTLATLRLLVIASVLVLLNRPTLSLTRDREEPSVLAVLVDTSASMAVADVEGQTRLEAARQAVEAAMPSWAETHRVRLFAFDETTRPVEELAEEADGEATGVGAAIASATSRLRGQNVAGIVVATDGRETGEATEPAINAPIYAVGLGGTEEPANVVLESAAAEATVFAGDVLNVSARVRVQGVADGTTLPVRLLRGDGSAATNPDGTDVIATATTSEDAIEVELQLETAVPEALDLVVAVDSPAGVEETSLADNRRPLRVDVLDTEIAVLYVEGYPRWEYRYLKNRLVRDRTINSSILLTGADPDFAQEGDRPIQRFPVTLDELLDYDVVLLGDVDPRQLSDGQLELIREFVGDAGGGFGMVAGPRHSPWGWAGTAVEALLPVDVVVEPSQSAGEAYRPIVTDSGRRAGLFRFFTDRDANETFLEEGLQQLYWFASGVRPKAGVGDVLAEHPDEVGPDGRPAPLVVVGRYGAGRTLFNAIDESWRWRFYTGEPVFDTFWVQQLRYLARGRKLGERRATLAVLRPSYGVGERATAQVRVLDPVLAGQLPDRLDATLRDADGVVLQTVGFERATADAGDDRFTATFTSPAAGGYVLTVPALSPETGELAADVSFEAPRRELARAAADPDRLTRLVAGTGGRMLSLADVASLDVPSAARRVPVVADRALWDAPLALGLIALLLTLEWIGRKFAGLV
jgi:hypothetical protein